MARVWLSDSNVIIFNPLFSIIHIEQPSLYLNITFNPLMAPDLDPEQQNPISCDPESDSYTATRLVGFTLPKDLGTS